MKNKQMNSAEPSQKYMGTVVMLRQQGDRKNYAPPREGMSTRIT